MIVNITEPLNYSLSDIKEPTTFNVVKRFSNYAITFTGDIKSQNRANRYDGYLPRIVVNCNYNSYGVKFHRLDNCIIDSVEVHRSLVQGCLFECLRQSHIRTITVNECYGDQSPAINFQPTMDPCNAINIDYLAVIASSNKTFLRLKGISQQKVIRNFNIETCFLHTAWDNLQLTDGKKEVYLPQEGRVLVDLEFVARTYFNNLNCRLDNNFTGNNTAIKLRNSKAMFRASVIGEKHHKVTDQDELSSLVDSNITFNLKEYE